MLTLSLFVPGLAAQDAAPQPRNEDVATIDGIIAALYGAISGPTGAERDWPRLRGLFVPDGRLMPTGQRQDGTGVRLSWSLEEYIERAGPGLMRDGFYEREIGRRLDRFGNIVQVFSTYDSRRTPEDAEPFMRGINSIQLWYDGARWWIVTVLWQSETPQYPIPAEYLSDPH
ncbi:MAG TPA: hypothetical protein PLL69_11455 [Gemmatimonadales bacterium]|nr:hypothetical protein [Gemmatimonadales bacterium]